MGNLRLREAAPTSVNVTVVFISERRAPLAVAGYQRMVARAGVAAKFTFLVHSHMLRHACGVQARQRRPRHSRHRSLSRPPIDHVHGLLYGLDAEPIQKLLEGLAFQASNDDSVRPVSADAWGWRSPNPPGISRRLLVSDCHIPECICRMARPIVFWA